MGRLDRSSPPYLPTWYVGTSAERRAGPADTIVAAEGMRVTFADGSSAEDWSGSMFVNNIGLGRPGMANVLRDQSLRLSWAAPERFVDVRLRLVEDLRGLLPSDLTTVHFTLAGSDGIEAAVRAARKATGRKNVLAFSFAYHGDTIATESLSDGMTPYGDPRPWVVRAPSPYEFWERWGDWDRAFERTAEAFDAVLAKKGRRTFAAVVLEPIMGSLCCVPLRQSLTAAIREACTRHGIKLVADEVITGFGRTGEWWGSTTAGLDPDAMVFAKGLTGGYAPLGAVVFEEGWGERLRTSGFPHGLTMSGHPLGCAAARETLRILSEEDLVARCARMGSRLRTRLEDVRGDHPETVRDVRGAGLLQAVELRGRGRWRRGAPHPATRRTNALRDTLRAAGMVVYVTPDGSSILLSPPFTVAEDRIDAFAASLDAGLSVTESH